MKHFALTLSLIVVLFPQAFAQAQSEQQAVSSCTLTLAQSPAVRGVKLGMPAQELFAMFPGSAEKAGIKSAMAKADGYPSFGFVEISFYTNEYPTTDRFAGVSHYGVDFLDGRILRYEVNYSYPPVGPRWNRVDDFIAKLTEGYNLPAARDWAVDPNASYQKSLKCNGFDVQASILNSTGNLRVSLPDYMKMRTARQTAYEEKMRRAFKP